LSSKQRQLDPAGNLPHDQLAKMFPTPPSHEHHDHQHTSPGDLCMELDAHGAVVMIKGEAVNVGKMIAQDLMDWNPHDELSASVMYASSKFTPVKLFSDELPTLALSEDHKYKPKSRSRQIMW
jgi:hypothetical protein